MLANGLAKWLLIVAAIGALGGCSMFSARSSDERRLSVLRHAPPTGMREVAITLNRASLKKALENEGAVRALRIIDIFDSAALGQGGMPRYRLFDIEPKSVYALLGLENADVLVGMDDRYIVQAELFRAAVRLLPAQNSASIEIERNESPLLLKYTIKD